MPEKEDSSEPKGSGSKLVMIAAVVAGMLLLYVLSLGPVTSLMIKTRGFDGKLSWETVRTVYAPVLWFYNHTSLKHPMDIYLGLWGVK